MRCFFHLLLFMIFGAFSLFKSYGKTIEPIQQPNQAEQGLSVPDSQSAGKKFLFPASEFPRALIQKKDISNGRANLANVDQAKNLFAWQQKNADFWAALSQSEIDWWIPDDGCYDVTCPSCGYPKLFSNDGHESFCDKCGMIFPNQDYPMDQSYEFTLASGKRKKYFYYEGKAQKYHNGENIGTRYFLDSPAKIYRLNRAIRGILGSAYAYLATGESRYADATRRGLLRFAEVYPDFPPRWRCTASATYEEVVNPKAGKLRGWKIHDSNAVFKLGKALDMTLNSGLYSDQERQFIDSGIFREYMKLIMNFPLSSERDNARTIAFSAIAICSLLSEEPAWREYLLDSPGGLKEFMDSFFLRDGAWHETSPAYTAMALVPLVDLVDLLNLQQEMPVFRRMLQSYASAIMPNQRMAPIGDSDHTDCYRPVLAEAGYRWFQTSEFAQLYQLFGKKFCKPESVFRMQAEFQAPAGEPWYLHESLIRSSAQWGILRRPGAAAVMTWAGKVGHGHDDMLNILFYHDGQELVHDLGYRGWPHPDTPFFRSTTAHNLVIVDGQNQLSRRRGRIIAFSGKYPVKAMIAEGDKVYPGVKTYRRTLVWIRNYLLDRFEVEGGKEHLYTFHAAGTHFTPPDLPFSAGELTVPRQDFLKEIFVGTLAGPSLSQWADTRLYLLEGGRYYHAVAPGQRSRRVKEEIPLRKVFMQRPGPKNIFNAVIEAAKPSDALLDIRKLNSESVQISAPDGTVDLVSFTDGITVTSSRDGQIISEFKMPEPVHGKILQADGHRFSVDLQLNSQWNDHYIFIDGQADASYRIANAKEKELILSPDENVIFQTPAEFSASPSSYWTK